MGYASRSVSASAGGEPWATRPNVEIVLHADSHYTCAEARDWCEVPPLLWYPSPNSAESERAFGRDFMQLGRDQPDVP